ncbi:MobF family relaxase [Aurantivibrio plasticivorans]
MLRVYASKNAAQAKDYFRDELTKGDYYSEGQEIVGRWGGRAATMLGLSDEVTQQAFNRLVDNKDPRTGERLTARHKEDRRPGYDFTFNAPKSVTLAYERTQDKRILEAFRRALHDTMGDIEKAMHTRVRTKGRNEDRLTGNIVYATFEHYTSRPVESMAPDPNLHCHAYCLNATYDQEEQKWKAGQFGQIKTDAPYYEALFHSRLAKRLNDLGLNTKRVGKFWEIADIERSTIEKFSNRTEEIEAYAKAHNIVDAKLKDKIGTHSRASKKKGLTLETLREDWWDRLDDAEKETLDNLFNNESSDKQEITADQCIDFAIAHEFERKSVLPLTRLKETALRYGFGVVGDDEIEQAFSQREDLLVHEHRGREMATTHNVLNEEQGIINFTVKGYGTQAKLNNNFEIGTVKDYRKNEEFSLSHEQENAVQKLLKSRNRVTAVQGKAGVGKTTMLSKLIEGIEDGDGEALVLAPTADAAYDTLRQDGETYRNETMQNAQTLARYFIDKKLWEESRGKALIVDEAGLMSVGDMHTLFALAHRFDNRVILVGDTAQHNSVNRGDAFRILQEEAGLKPLAIDTIRRQSGEYRKAVTSLAKGDVMKGYDKLDDMKAITEEGDDEIRYRTLADKYAGYVKAKEKVLAIAPTHAEGKQVTEAIRNALKEGGHIGKREKAVTRYRNLQLTEAQKADHNSYQKGQVVRFQLNAKSIRKGDQFTVSRIEKGKVFVEDKNGSEKPLDTRLAKRFSLYTPEQLPLAKGDSIRLTEGTKALNGSRLNNGAILKVDAINKQGDIVLEGGRVLDGSKGNFDYGYVTTSHASQGKTVPHVLIAQNTQLGGASGAEQFYVSVSRGKHSVEIFTDDKEALREQVERSQQRMSATKLTRNQMSIPQKLVDSKTLLTTLEIYANYALNHLKGTTKDWLAHFRQPDKQPANDRLWRDRVERERQHQDRDMTL